jgi:hypothetical protein
LVSHIEGLRVLENKVSEEDIRASEVEVTGEWRELRDEELHDLYYSRNFICVIKSRDGRGM